MSKKRQHIKNELRYYKRKILYTFTTSSHNVCCPICGWKGDFFRDYDCGYGSIYKNAECPVCMSHPRHRLVYLYLKRELDRKKQIQFLHFSPEEALVRYLQAKRNIAYLSVDIDSKKAMRRENAENLTFQNNSFDVVLCLCVLEHVHNDKKAMKEIYRVVKRGGLCIFDVPIDYSLPKTLEDSSIVTAKARARLYWQKDHVRLYGRDFASRLKAVGFIVSPLRPDRLVDKDAASYFGLPTYPIHLARKK